MKPLTITLLSFALFAGMPAAHAGLQSNGLTSQGSDFQGTDFQGTDFQGVDGQGVDAQGVDAQGVDAQGTDAQGVDAQGVATQAADARGTNAPAAQPLSHALETLSLHGEPLSDARLVEGELTARTAAQVLLPGR